MVKILESGEYDSVATRRSDRKNEKKSEVGLLEDFIE